MKLGPQVKASVQLVGQKTLLECGPCKTGLKIPEMHISFYGLQQRARGLLIS